MHRRTHVNPDSCVMWDNGLVTESPGKSKKLSKSRKYKRPLEKRSEQVLGLLLLICTIYLLFKWFTPFEYNCHPRYLVWEHAINSFTDFRSDRVKHDRYIEPMSSWSAADEGEEFSNYEPASFHPWVQEEPIEPCQPMHQWMKESFPSCNNMHEIQLFNKADSLLFINCGGSRCAFRINDFNGDPLVLKTQKYLSEFIEKDFSDAQIDALAMERLSASPYITKLFCGCSTSQLVEYSIGGNIHDLVKLARFDGEDRQPPLDRLKIAYQIATAVANVHTFENDGIVSLTHNDLCCHQFILVDGIYKLTDFHLSTFHRRDRKTHEVCQTIAIPVNEVLMKLRAPEEQFIEIDEERIVLMDKVDVYMMGNVIFYVLTKMWLFESITTDEATASMVQGVRSTFPEDMLTSDDPAIQAVVTAIKMCWTHEPEDRPTAREVSLVLRKALEDILGSTNLGVIRVSIPPLPRDYRFSDSDFYVNLGGEL